jgi:hypothetical protein
LAKGLKDADGLEGFFKVEASFEITGFFYHYLLM